MTDILTYQEMLRTLGAFVEIANVTDVGLVVALDEGALVYGRSWPGPTVWTMADIGEEASSQRSWRVHPRRDRTPRAGPIADCLRAIGAILDADADSQGPYTLTVERGGIRLQGRQGAESCFEFAPPRPEGVPSAARATGSDRPAVLGHRPQAITAVAAGAAPAAEGPADRPIGRRAVRCCPPRNGQRVAHVRGDPPHAEHAVRHDEHARGGHSPVGAGSGSRSGGLAWAVPVGRERAAVGRGATARPTAGGALRARPAGDRESTRYLRVVGAELDRQGHHGEYVLKLRGSQVAVETAAGETWTFEREAIEQLETGLQHGRGPSERRAEHQPPRARRAAPRAWRPLPSGAPGCALVADAGRSTRRPARRCAPGRRAHSSTPAARAQHCLWSPRNVTRVTSAGSTLAASAGGTRSTARSSGRVQTSTRSPVPSPSPRWQVSRPRVVCTVARSPGAATSSPSIRLLEPTNSATKRERGAPIDRRRACPPARPRRRA